MSGAWPQLTADEWANVLEQNLEVLHGPNSITARTCASNLASGFVGDSPFEPVELLKAARERIPTIAPDRSRVGFAAPQPAPNDRTPAFDEAVDAFIALFRENIERRRAFEQEVAANIHLDYEHCIDIVLAFLVTQRDALFVRPIIVGTKLSHDQVVDALQWISDRGLMSSESQHTEHAWLVKVNSFARAELTRRRGENKPHRQRGSIAMPEPKVNINMHFGSNNTFNNSPVGVSGASEVEITHAIVLPEMPASLRTAVEANPFAAEAVAELDKELVRRVPRKTVAERLFGTAKTAVSVLTAGTEIAEHGNEWLEGVQSIIEHIADVLP